MAQKQQRNLGKISLVNGDEHMSVVATAVIITERGVVKIKDETKGTYVLCGCEKPSLCMCVRWVHQYKDKIQKQSVYINDPDAAAGYAANIAKAEREKEEKARQTKQKPHINVKHLSFVISIVNRRLSFHLCLFAHHSVCLNCLCFRHLHHPFNQFPDSNHIQHTHA